MPMKRLFYVLLALFVAGSAAHAQQTAPDRRTVGSNPQASAAVQGQSGMSASAAVPSAGVPVGDDYLIGPDDEIEVFVWRNPDLSKTLPVRPDGKISTPLVEDMVAVGKTPYQLARDVEAVLTEYIISPQVNVIVTEAKSTFGQIKVIGEVGQPQSIAYREGLRVLDVILQAGGLGDFARGNSSYILRHVEGKEKKIPVKLKDLWNKGGDKYNLPMAPGDVLVVPQSRF